MAFRSSFVALAWVLACGASLTGSRVWGQTAGPAGAAPQLLPISQTEDAQPIADPLLVQVEEAIRVNGQRFLTANYHSPWQIFHGILAYRRDFLLKVGEEKQPAIDWVASADPRFDNLPLIMVTQHGAKFHPFTRPYAFEGHPGQTLALLSESHLPTDFPLKVGNQTVTIGQILQNTMMEVNTREETTWVLWALINYLKVDAQWTNQWGQPWSIESLVRNEIAAHTPTRPCGGNHNLFALTRARDKYVKTGRPLRGVWMEADQKIRQYVELARSLQNSDGSFSSNFYKGPGFSQDMNTRFNTTGHTMEFLSIALPAERLNEPWVRKGVDVLSRELILHRKAAVDCGPLYHSVNALKNYYDRVRPPEPVVVALADPPKDVPVTPAAPQPGTSPAAPMPAVPLPNAPMPTAPMPVVTVDPPSASVPAKLPENVTTKPLAPARDKPAFEETIPLLPKDSIESKSRKPEGPVSALAPENG